MAKASPRQTVTLRSGGSSPEIRVTVGFSNEWRLRLDQWNPAAQRWQLKGEGTTNYTFPDPPAALSDKDFRALLLQVSPTGEDQFIGKIDVFQDDQLAPGGDFPESDDSLTEYRMRFQTT